MLVYEAWLIMRTYNEDGELDATFRAGTTITIEENITTTGGTPGEDCDCVTDMYIYDWSGNLLGSYLDMESLSIFATKSLVVTPLENKFSAYLDPSIFPDPNGEVVLLEATCQINWGSAAGYADVAVGLPEPDPSTMVTPGGALWLFLVLVGAV
ncbi:hypothetical protein Pelo_13379 [Pelomyxa schiedti]|nr:hypothetical protein Pelo_13379 [Pelomyxa schiedti]